MSRLTFKKSCPRCGSESLERLQRKEWMRWVPSSKYYRCKKCRSRMIMLYDSVGIKLR